MSRRVELLVGLLLSGAIAAATHASDGPEWVERVEWSDDGPEAREHASVMVLDGRVVVYAGSGYAPQGQPLADAWSYDTDDKSWTRLEIEGDAPTAGGSKRVAHIPGSNSAYVFGGYGQSFTPSNELHRVTLEGGSLAFKPVEQVNPPPARALHAFAFDPETDRFIAALGVAPTGFFGDTWVGAFDDQGRVVWREVEGGPSPRFGFSYGFDTDSGELVVLSGQTPPTPDAPMVMTDELWVLDCRGDDPAWRRVALDDPPAGRRNPTFVYDDARDVLVAWCGTADGRTNVEDIVMVQRDETGEWCAEACSDQGFPPRRSSGFGFADPDSDKIYVGFGNSAEGRYQDWVVLDVDPD